MFLGLLSGIFLSGKEHTKSHLIAHPCESIRFPWKAILLSKSIQESQLNLQAGLFFLPLITLREIDMFVSCEVILITHSGFPITVLVWGIHHNASVL